MTAEAIVFLWVSPHVACLHMLVPIATIPLCHASGFAVGNPAWVAACAWKAATMSASWRALSTACGLARLRDFTSFWTSGWLLAAFLELYAPP